MDPGGAQKDVADLAKGAGIILGGRLSGRVLHLVGQAAVARLLGAEAFGLYAIGWTLLNMVGLLALLGLDKGAIRFIAKSPKDKPGEVKGTIRSALGIALAGGLVAGVGLYLMAPWLAVAVFKKPELVDVFRWFAPAFVFMVGMRVATASTRATKRMHYSVIAEDFTQPFLNLLLIFAFYWVGWQLLGAVVAGVLSFGVSFLLGLHFVRRLFGEALAPEVPPARVAGDLILFSIPTALAGTFTFYTLRIDRLLVGYFRSAGEVGLYQAASQSALLFGIILGAFGTIFMPMIVDLYHRKEFERLDELFKVSTKWGLYLSLPLFLVLWFAPAEVLSGIFGAGFEAGASTLKILAVAQLINVSTGTVGPMLIMTGHQKQWLAISASMLVLNLALSTLLIPQFGITGAAVASGCALTGLFVLGLATIKRLLGVWPYDWRYLKGIAAAGAAYLALQGILKLEMMTVFFDGLLLRIMILSFIAPLVFVSGLTLLGLSDEDRTVISLVVNKIKALVMLRR